MTTKTLLTSYFVTLPVFLLIDAVWLSTMASRLYKPTLGDMMAADFRVMPAIIFYAMFVAGLVYFAVLPAIAQNSALAALMKGGAFGLFCYATYDLTNQATLRNWSTLLTVADLLWGTTLSAISAVIGFNITRMISGA